MKRPSTRLLAKFVEIRSTVDPTPAGCLEWPGGRSSAGYGMIRVGDEICYVHRLAWYDAHGLPPDDKPEIRHVVCDNPPCCAVEHLLPGTHAENMADMAAHGRGVGWHAKKTHCPKGHPYSGDNLAIKRSGARRCRQCTRDERAKWRRKQGIPEKSNFCPHGHEFTPENTRMKKSGKSTSRVCKACEKERRARG